MSACLYPRLLEGEALDVQFSFRPLEAVGEADVRRMMRLKTGVLLEFAARAGAAIGAGGPMWDTPRADALGRFALECGNAFQLQDDILGIVGEERKLGKPVGADLREGKRTLIVLEALRRATPADRALLQRVLGDRAAAEADICRVRDCLVRLGALEHARREAEGCLRRALDALTAAVPPSAARDLLLAWARGMIARDF
jgi:geranylgeranyl pyrophosphate synthase